MADIAIFEDDVFSVSSLTAAINDQEYLPGRISSLGLFREEGISTLTVQIEKDGDTLALVPAGERGTSGLVVGGSKRKMIPFNTVHFSTYSSMPLVARLRGRHLAPRQLARPST